MISEANHTALFGSSILVEVSAQSLLDSAEDNERKPFFGAFPFLHSRAEDFSH